MTTLEMPAVPAEVVRAVVEALRQAGGGTDPADPAVPAGPAAVAEALLLAAQLRLGPADRLGAGLARPPADSEPAEVPAVPVAPVPTDPLLVPAGPKAPATDYALSDGQRGGLPADARHLTLTSSLAVLRALRLLRLRRPGPAAAELDEPATADRSAGGRWEVVLRPPQTRWPDIAVVLDDSPLASMWSPVLAELQSVLHQLGAFREVQLCQLQPGDADERGADKPVLRRWPVAAAAGVAGRPVRGLADPTGRRIIVLLTDGSGAGWRDGTRQELLAYWARHSPVAVVSTVPERLWAPGGLRSVFAEVQAPGPLRANRCWSVRAGRFHPEQISERVRRLPIPVVDCGPRRLGALATLVAGERRWTPMRLLAEPAARRAGTGTGGGRAAAPVGAERVAQFRSRAEPKTFQTLLYLSWVPLLEPLVERVVERVLPEPHWLNRFEILHSDLVAPILDDRGIRAYRFHEGVRSALNRRANPLLRSAVHTELFGYATRELRWDPERVSALLAEPDNIALLAAVTGGMAESSPYRLRVGGGAEVAAMLYPASPVGAGPTRPVLRPFALAAPATPRLEAAAHDIADRCHADGALPSATVTLARGAELAALSAEDAVALTMDLLDRARGGLLLMLDLWPLADRRSWVAQRVAHLLVGAMAATDGPAVALAGPGGQLGALFGLFPRLAELIPPERVVSLPESAADDAFTVFSGYLRVRPSRRASHQAWRELDRQLRTDPAGFAAEEAGRALYVEVVRRWRHRTGGTEPVDLPDIPTSRGDSA
jgi:hypothetical protein